jgi:hypothetical protein
LLVPFYLGYLIVALILNKEKDASALERIALSYLIGTGALSYFIFILSWIGIKLGLFSIIVPLFILAVPLQIAVVKKNAMFLGFKFKKTAPFSLIELSLLAYVALKLSYSVFEALVKPVTACDAYVHHMMKAKAIFIDHTISPSMLKYLNAGVGYPMNVPINAAWTYFCLGQWNDALGQAIFPALFICAALLLYASLSRYSSRSNSLLGVFMLTSLPLVVFHSTISYADLPVAIYNLAAVIFLFNYLKTMNTKYIWIASILSACALWTKNEGMAYFLMNAAVLSIPVMIEHRNNKGYFLRTISAYSTLPFLAAIGWGIFKIASALPVAVSLERSGMINYLERVVPTINIFLWKIFLNGNWNILWFILSLIVVFRFNGIIKDSSRYILLLIIMNIAFYFIYYLTASPEIYSFVLDGTVLCRNLMTVSLIAVFFAAYNLPLNDK